MKHWVVRYTSLFTSPTPKVKILDLPVGSIVTKGQTKGNMSEVEFITRSKIYVGWVYSIYLEELVYHYPENTVFTQQTDYPYDAAQYIIWEGSVLFNLCGEACVAHIFKDTVENLLTAWKARPASLYNKIIHGGKSATTGIADLVDMVSVYNGETASIKISLYDPISRSALISPHRLKVLLEEYSLIVGCKISGSTGELKTSGIPHWITLENVVEDGINKGSVEIWNPFSGRTESYSWREFVASIYPIYGLLVKRDSN